MVAAILKTVALKAVYEGSVRARWHVARTLWGIDAVVLNYRWRGLQRIVYRLWPRGYSREVPPWAMRAPFNYSMRRR